MSRPPLERSVSVVLPCLDEVESVGLCVEEALQAFADGGIDGEVIIVDNGSTDGSPEVAEAAGARVVHEEVKGYGAALRAGFAVAQKDVVVMADADYTYNLSMLPELVAPVVEGRQDLMMGSRLNEATQETMPFLHRYVGTPTLTFLSARACGRRVTSDSQSGYRAFRRDCLPELALTSTGMELASEMLVKAARAGLRIGEIDAGYRPRIGESKLSTWSDGWRHLQLLLMLAPDVALIWPGTALIALGTLMLGLAFIRPAGVGIGSLQWQPVFFSGIAIVIGVLALLAGAVIAHYSSTTLPVVSRRFAFLGQPNFPRRCVAVGGLFVVVGLGINLVMFIAWLGGSSPGQHAFGFASLSQTLIIVGAILASFGLISRFLRARSQYLPAATTAVPSDTAA